ncbi:glycoprotein L [Harp seal herpesvirus]|uniref:Glycoprotein L n=1 Tax=phocid gammaherpesvirus 3 TaxID=2560643 RepID=A0A0R5ZDT2_9GAMA|nr:glycoprotein L [Harp seal herpesvirus]AJG42972.1 glycoprotein L [Harp seal herpesvirus]
MASEISLPVVGVSSENEDLWKSHLNTYFTEGRLSASLTKLKAFFGKEGDLGLLASLVILQAGYGASQKHTHKTSIIDEARKSRETAVFLYKKLKDHEHGSGIDLIFTDCKERLCLILEEDCGCVECAHTIQQIQNSHHNSTPPKLNPHVRQCNSHDVLMWLHNSVVLNLDINLMEQDIEALYENPSDFKDFSTGLHGELALLTSCLNFCWLFYMLQHFITLEFSVLEECMQNTCEKLKLSTDTSVVAVIKFLLHYVKDMEAKYSVVKVNIYHLGNSSAKLKDSLQQPASLPPCTVSRVLEMKSSHSGGVQPISWPSQAVTQFKHKFQKTFHKMQHKLQSLHLTPPPLSEGASKHDQSNEDDSQLQSSDDEDEEEPQLLISDDEDEEVISDDEDEEEPQLMISDDEDENDDKYEEEDDKPQLLISHAEEEQGEKSVLVLDTDKNKPSLPVVYEEDEDFGEEKDSNLETSENTASLSHLAQSSAENTSKLKRREIKKQLSGDVTTKVGKGGERDEKHDSKTFGYYREES